MKPYETTDILMSNNKLCLTGNELSQKPVGFAFKKYLSNCSGLGGLERCSTFDHFILSCPIYQFISSGKEAVKILLCLLFVFSLSYSCYPLLLSLFLRTEIRTFYLISYQGEYHTPIRVFVICFH